jgi:hypothetical protein
MEGKIKLIVMQSGEVWDRPMYISQDTANRIKQKHNIDSSMSWRELEPSIRNALQDAQVHKSYLVEALWKVDDSAPGQYYSVTYNVVLQLL